jgi:hypothetical protein
MRVKNMKQNIFKSINDWKDFERLCADILSAEGFTIITESFKDDIGSDLIVKEEYLSHDPDRKIEITWRVQCKHYSKSGKNLGRKEIEEIIYNYNAHKKIHEGLFIIIDTDYSENAKRTIDKYLENHKEARITIWNYRHLLTKIERHQLLLNRYGLKSDKKDNYSIFNDLKKYGEIRTLIISDQSIMAHNLNSILRNIDFNVTYLPFWNYQDLTRIQLFDDILNDNYQLIISFLGDSFRFPIPDQIINKIFNYYEKGSSILFFPFFAWSIAQGIYTNLRDIIPVKLENINDFILSQALNRITGDYRRGDFRFLLAFDSFAEDQYIELDPACGDPYFTRNISNRFGLSHSFEYLQLTNNGKSVWNDTTGNPIVIINNNNDSKICYFNTCCHSCLSVNPILSPLEVSHDMAILMKNILEWLLDVK